jgi:hypothetical protein
VRSKIPPDAFDFYAAQGEHRSYQATAEKFGVSKTAITKCAKREGWGERLAKIEADARAISDRKLTESLAEMQERHLKIVKAMSARVLSGLRDYPIMDGMDAIRAADMVIKLERLLAGEASKRTELSIEDITRHEIRTLLRVVPNEEPRLVEAGVVAGGDDEDDRDEDGGDAERDEQ